MSRRRLVICGAAGRDFHNFNVGYRDDPDVEVVAFTATQIPGIANRRYPPQLAGPHYPAGIPIREETELATLIRDEAVSGVVFAYSDIAHADVMHVASRVVAAGADFEILGPGSTSLAAGKPVVAVSAVRTGCGKSQIARFLAQRLRELGLRVSAIRHAMPYGDLTKQIAQRFASMADIAAADCTLEEREEYEAHVACGNVIYAGVDYAAILERAQADADVLVWDGGNNDFPFIAPDLHVVVVDALRPSQLTTHFPGEAVLRMADVIVLNKVNAATREQREEALAGIRDVLPDIPVVQAASPVTLEAPEAVAGKRVVVVEDGPTITHGGMPHGAGYQAVTALNATIVDPRPFAHPDLLEAYDHYPHIGPVLPALGYSDAQLAALVQTIDAVDADVVVAGTPIDLANVITTNKPVIRARYEHRDHGEPRLMDVVEAWLSSQTGR